jgi:hypothetical protein
MTGPALLVPALVVHPRQRAIQPWIDAAPVMVARARDSLRELTGINLGVVASTRIIEVSYETQATFRAEWWNLYRQNRTIPPELLVAFSIGTNSRDSEYDGWASGRGGNGVATLSTAGLIAIYSWQQGRGDEVRVNRQEWLVVHEILHMLEEPHAAADPRSADCDMNPMCYTAGTYDDWKRYPDNGYGLNADQLGRLRRLGYVGHDPARMLSIRASALAETIRLMGEDVDAARGIAEQLGDRYRELKALVVAAEHDVPD